MLKFAADENFNNDIVRGLTRRIKVDVIRVQDTEVTGAADDAVLEWAAREGRILLTHDLSTMTKQASDRVSAGRRMPGALFDEEPQDDGFVRLRVELRDACPGELGLCLLVLKDLLTGEVAIGGTSSAGRGRLTGTAKLFLEDGRGHLGTKRRRQVAVRRWQGGMSRFVRAPCRAAMADATPCQVVTRRSSRTS